MSNIILLNGASSSGKTTLACAIQHKSPSPWLRLGIDTLFDMMPLDYLPSGTKAKEGLNFLPEVNENGPSMNVALGPWGQQVLNCLPLMIKLLADQHMNIIVDEVILEPTTLDAYVRALSAHKVYFVGVFCDLPTMQEREILRGNRSLGLANAQEKLVHLPNYIYDITVDATSRSPFSLATEILEFIRLHPTPKSFVDLRHRTE